MKQNIPVPRSAHLFFETVVVTNRIISTTCDCFCHEDWGGGAHPSQSCRCRGGGGFDDLSLRSVNT